MVTRTRPTPAGWSGPDWLDWLVAALVIGSAVVLSFAGLAELARASLVAGWLVYLWPVSLDATGVLSTRIWLNRRAPADARRAARALALTAIGLSIGGNGLWHWLIEQGERPHVLVQIAVGAVPPTVLAATLHVLSLAARRPDQPAPATGQAATDRPATRPASRAAGWSGRVVVTTARPVPPPMAVLHLPAPTLAGQPTDPIDQPISHPTSQPARVLAERLDALHRPPASPPLALAAELAGRRGAWRALVDPARPIVAARPGIGREALAAELSARLGQDVPTSQARKVLDCLAAEQPTTNTRPQQTELPAADTTKETAGV
ncbi:DUF2637 domain-containing protein [Saccharothrix lopnurensis]|uniref:DUF2637 domain-containing protein n=1 Tax=Saccharothrix lopnurensis TaxID=1670621 RepID=A0ABW1P1H4_9PSEU